MKTATIILAGAVALWETSSAFGQSAGSTDAQKELAALRQEMLQMKAEQQRQMQQMKAAQRKLLVRIEELSAAPRTKAPLTASGAAYPVKGPQTLLPSFVQIPAPPGSTGPNVTTVSQVWRSSVNGIPSLTSKAPGMGNTLSARVWGIDVGLYGFADVSFDRAYNGKQSINEVSSNESLLGVAGGIDTPFLGWRGIYQIETTVEVSATPGAANALGSRNSFVGLSSPYGAVMIGKYDTPYKRSTALMNPFEGSIGDYNSIMGNTAGEGRAEFDYRMSHAVWYDSPDIHGFTLNAMYAPGQKLADLPAASNYAFPQGELVCSGSQQTSLNGATPNAQGAQTLCNDGAFTDAYSVALNYTGYNFYAIAAYELHKSVNRQSDAGGVVADEGAAKVGVSYHFGFGNQLSFIYEYLYRNGVNPATNERQRSGLYVSDVQNIGYGVDFIAAYAHAFQTPGSPKFPGLNDQVDMYTAGLKYHFNEHMSLYVVAAYLTQGPGAHYGLGAGEGHGTAILSPRTATGGPLPGQTLDGVSAGAQVSF